MPRIVDHDQRREELAKHVWTLIRKQGLDGVTIRSLSAESGWSSGAIRHYLPTRESILTFAAERLSSGVTDHLRHLEASESEAPLDAFEGFLLALLPLDDESREWTEVWLAFAAAAVRGENYADSYGILYRDLHAALLEILRDFDRLGGLPAGTPEQAACEVHALLDGLTLHLLLRQISVQEAREALSQTLEKVITG